MITKNNDINLNRLTLKEQHKILDIIYSDENLHETFDGERNTESRLGNASYVAFIEKKKKTNL